MASASASRCSPPHVEAEGVRGRTLVFAGLDEACFFFDETTGVVNDADLYRAVLQRVVSGGQVWIVSTPWLADTGLLETTIAKNWGSHEHALADIFDSRAESELGSGRLD
jgi:hypothetical protein